MDNKISNLKCPICGTSDLMKIFAVPDRFNPDNKDRFELLQCDQCELRLTYPAPKEDEIDAYYLSSDYDPFISEKDEKSLRDRIYLLIRDIQLKQKKHWVENLLSGGTICDYGCSTGEFLSVFPAHRWNTIGFEKDLKAVQYAQDKGLKVFPADQFYQYSSSVDVITFWHALEHLHDPMKALTRSKGILDADGILIIALPNYLSTDAEIFGKDWVAYDAPRHLYHFSPNALINLVAGIGFDLFLVRPMLFDPAYNCLLSEYLRKYPYRISISHLALSLLKTYTSLVFSSIERSSSLVYFFRKKD